MEENITIWRTHLKEEPLKSYQSLLWRGDGVGIAGNLSSSPVMLAQLLQFKFSEEWINQMKFCKGPGEIQQARI